MLITAEKFKASTGREPMQDDLDRCNCQLEEFGHSQCGWCDVHDKPRFICLCSKEIKPTPKPPKPTYHGSGVYKGAGKYVAICNNMNFDGHYTKEFEVPVADPPIYNSASWYFLNVVDFSACLEAVYPKAIFDRWHS